MIHSNPFTDYGHDIHNLERQLQQKVEKHELDSFRGTVDRLEHTMRELSAALDEVRAKCNSLEEHLRIGNYSYS